LGGPRLADGERREVAAVVAEVGRARWADDRRGGAAGGLLVEVLWSVADGAWRRLRSEVPDGPDRAATVALGFIECVLAPPGMQHPLMVDPDLTMPLLTHPAAGFQPRLLRAVEDLLREETAAGRLAVPMDTHELAYVVVRVIESYTYLDVLLGERPEAHRAEAALRLLLGPRSS